jgi:hypothetical protein
MKEFKVGDRVFVEQAWEDHAGHYHNEYATVKEIRGLSIYLTFDKPEVDEFLDGCDYEAYQLSQLGC